MSPIFNSSLPKNVTVCSIILPEIPLIWALALTISWFHQVPTGNLMLAIPLYEDPSIIKLLAVASTRMLTYLSFLFCLVLDE